MVESVQVCALLDGFLGIMFFENYKKHINTYFCYPPKRFPLFAKMGTRACPSRNSFSWCTLTCSLFVQSTHFWPPNSFDQFVLRQFTAFLGRAVPFHSSDVIFGLLGEREARAHFQSNGLFVDYNQASCLWQISFTRVSLCILRN